MTVMLSLKFPSRTVPIGATWGASLVEASSTVTVMPYAYSAVQMGDCCEAQAVVTSVAIRAVKRRMGRLRLGIGPLPCCPAVVGDHAVAAAKRGHLILEGQPVACTLVGDAHEGSHLLERIRRAAINAHPGAVTHEHDGNQVPVVALVAPDRHPAVGGWRVRRRI